MRHGLATRSPCSTRSSSKCFDWRWAPACDSARCPRAGLELRQLAWRQARLVRSALGMTFDANAIFEDELSRRGTSFVREGAHEYRIRRGTSMVTANLTNVRRNAERDGDPDLIRRFVDKVLSAFPSEIPEWREASSLLLWAAEPTDSDFGDTIRISVTDEVSRVLTLTDRDQTKVTWVTQSMCDEWGVTIAEAGEAAYLNQERLLDGIELEVAEEDDRALGMIPLASPYKASVVFARAAFRRLVEPVLGWPVLIVLPCRDFVYVMADNSPLVDQIGSVVVNEFEQSGYPITTEVLRVSDDGIEAIGNFPT
jgi:hypothetical protein